MKMGLVGVMALALSGCPGAGSGGTVTTLAGNGTVGDVDGTGGPTGSAEFGGPSGGPAGVAVDAAGNGYVADTFNNRIRKISP